MKTHSNKLRLLVALLWLFSACSPLSKVQLSSIGKFTNACDSFSRYPSLLFTEVASIRFERGLFYASSLNEAQNRVDELNALHKGYIQDMQLAATLDASLKILNSYSYALKLLVSGNRSATLGTEIRSVGRVIDSLTISINKLNIFKEALPTGIGKSATSFISMWAESLIERKQHRLAKNFIFEADTLIQVLVAGLVETLQEPQVAIIIENEKRGIDRNYISFLQKEPNCQIGIESDKKYLDLVERARQLTYTRGYTTTAAKRLATVHKEIVLNLEKRKGIEHLIEELLKLKSDLELIQKEYNTIISLI